MKQGITQEAISERQFPPRLFLGLGAPIRPGTCEYLSIAEHEAIRADDVAKFRYVSAQYVALLKERNTFEERADAAEQTIAKLRDAIDFYEANYVEDHPESCQWDRLDKPHCTCGISALHAEARAAALEQK